MRIILAGLVLGAVLSMFGPAALHAAGDIGPDGGFVPPAIQVGGDIGPDGG